MSWRSGALVALMSGPVAGLAAELVTLDSRVVVAWPAQILREQPAVDASVVATVDFGEQVAVFSSDEPGLPTTIGGLEGRWVEVHWEGARGWMFDAWLLPLPAPPADCVGLDAWTARWTPAGAVLTEWNEDPATGQAFPQRIQGYIGGMRRVVPEGEESPAAELWLPGVSAAQAWFVARRCHPVLAPVSQAAWPPRSVRGLAVSRVSGNLTITDAQGVVLLELRPEPEGVWLAWR